MCDWTGFDLTAIRGEALAMAENAPPLERGQYVAWTIQGDFGYTQSLPSRSARTSSIVTSSRPHCATCPERLQRCTARRR